MGNDKDGDEYSDGVMVVGSDNGGTPSLPGDRWGFVLWSVYFMGLVMMLPWNMLITVNYYWDYKVTDKFFTWRASGRNRS